MKHLMSIGTLVALAVVLVGCGGGGGSNGGGSGGEAEQNFAFGPLRGRIIGTAQPPITAGGSGAVVTGVAGGDVTGLVLRDTSPTLAETLIAFASGRDNPQGRDIYVMDSNGTNAIRLTTHPAFDSNPALSPDGSKIAFESTRNGNFEIYVMNADGTNQTRLTNNAAVDNGPSWSPDGAKIAFASNRDGNSEIYVMNADGTNQTRLTNNTANDTEPDWSPDGTKIAFTSARDGQLEIYVMNINGTSQTRLTNEVAFDISSAWSPDGARIAFTSSRDGNFEIYVMNANGANQTRLTNNTVSDGPPTWSPDGAKIAFTSARDGNAEIYVMNDNGSSQTRLTNNGALDDLPFWGPFVPQRTLIGTGGLLGTAAAGFLFARSRDVVTSIVAFDTAAGLRETARVTAQTGLTPGLPNVVFTVTADSLTRLAFINGNNPKVTVVIGTGGAASAATGALVDFNATNGQVTAVLPFTANRSEGIPTITQEKAIQVLQGHFLGVWDGRGHNLAPTGAREVRLDARTGEVMAVQ